MQSNKDKLKKDPKSEKRASDSGKKTTTTTKTTVKKSEDKKVLTKSDSRKSTYSAASTRPQTSRPVDTKAVGKGSSKVTTQSKTPKSIDMHKRLPKFMELIEKKKIFSGINSVLQKRFKHWVDLTFSQKRQITEKTQKTIMTKKRLNIRRVSQSRQVQKPGEKTKSTSKGQTSTITTTTKTEDKKPISTKTVTKTEEKTSTKKLPLKKLSPEEEQRRIKIRKFIESRIVAYEANKSLIKKYFEIWLGRRTLSLTTKEVTKKNVVTKKRIFLVKEKTKPLFDEKAKETQEGQKGQEGNADVLKRIRTLPVRPSISATGTRALIENSAQRESRASKNLVNSPEEMAQFKDNIDKIVGQIEKKAKKDFKLRDKKNRDEILIILKKIMKRPLKKYFNIWKVIKIQKEAISQKSTTKVITKNKIRITKKTKGAKEGETEEYAEEETMQTTEGVEAEEQTKPKEPEMKSATIQEIPKEPKRELKSIPLSKKDKKFKNLLLVISRNKLIKYFKIWKNKSKYEEHETISKGTKKTVIKKKIINVTKKTKDKNEKEQLLEEEMPKNINLEIPMCPISETCNYMKDVYNTSLIQYHPEDILSVPPRESKLRSNLDVSIKTEESGHKKRPKITIKKKGKDDEGVPSEEEFEEVEEKKILRGRVKK